MTEKEFRIKMNQMTICTIKLKGTHRGLVINKIMNELVNKLEFEEDK